MKKEGMGLKKLLSISFISIAMLLIGAIFLAKPMLTGMAVVEGNIVENGSLLGLALLIGGVIIFLMKEQGKI